MCGIAGWFDAAKRREPGEVARIAAAMNATLAHRGPDGEGHWADPNGSVALAHRRLAILELSPLGAQPMRSGAGRYVIAFNGEIYNFRELRRELESRGRVFRGHSDTEIVLGLFDEVGVPAALPRLVGMFALASWDTVEHKLHLARDRFGEKPLYYGRTADQQGLVFGSELKALRAHPDFEPRVDRASLVKYFRHGWVPGPRTIYKGVAKLPAGTYLEVRAGIESDAPVPYYSARDVAAAGLCDPLHLTLEEAAEELDHTLRRAIRRQMIADVPLGALLSGGIDSSTVVALMQQESAAPVRTYTVGFWERGYDEARFARRVAAHLRTNHTELYVTAEQALALVPDLSRIYDEPFADSSQIPTILLARMARVHVTVALSGDGGDELLGGYTRYALLRQLDRVFRTPGRRACAEGAAAMLARASQWMAPNSRAYRGLEWVRRRVEFLRAGSLDAFYAAYLSTWHDPESLVLGGREPAGLLPLAPGFLAGSPTERAMLADTLLYLPDDILVKVDRAAMSTGLETRIPLLDPDVFALCWRLPYATKVRGKRGKVVLRRVLTRYLPTALFERPKAGFAVPMGAWLRGPLRAWAEALLDEGRLRAEGFLSPPLVRKRWSEHLAGTRDWQFSLWTILTWQAWLESSKAQLTSMEP